MAKWHPLMTKVSWRLKIPDLEDGLWGLGEGGKQCPGFCFGWLAKG